MVETTRRTVILAGASGLVAALAGCGGDGGDGSDGEGNGGTDGDGGTGGGDTETQTADGSDGEPSDGTTDTQDQNTGGDRPRLGKTVAFPDSYAMNATVSTGGQTLEMSGRFHQGDLYWEFEQQGQQMKWYLVGGESYVVTQGQCIKGMMQGSMNRDDVDPGMFSTEANAHPDIEPKGRETIDGQEVLVYEVSASEASEFGETVRYYVLADSGYPRRIESESMRWDFHSWGAVDPISKPEMNCQSMPGSGMTPTG